MGLLLREVLRTLCEMNQWWSYAVFWKFGCHNPKLLIWEECHYQHTSGIANPQLPFGEWEGQLVSGIHSSQNGIQAGDKVQVLISKMMINNQVNLVGEGLLGRAAFMGNHVWILANNYVGDGQPPEVSNELHRQFSAGMQTIAVIPVSPHGVVQFGSSLAIMENMGFVNDVKSLIVQLGCIPGALLSGNHQETDSVERIGVPISLGMPVSGLSSENYNVFNPTPVLDDSYNQQSITAHHPRFAKPSSSQIRLSIDNPQCTIFHSPTQTKFSVKSFDGHSNPKIIQTMVPVKTLRGQIKNGVVEAEVTPTKPDAWLSQQTASYNSRPGLRLQQQILSGDDGQNHVSNNKCGPDGCTTTYVRTNGGMIQNPQQGSVKFGRKMHDKMHSCSPLINCKSTNFSNSSKNLARAELKNFDSSRVEEVPLSSLVDQLSASGILSGFSDYTHMYHSTDVNPKIESNAWQEKMDIALSHAPDIPLAQPNERMSLNHHVNSSARDCLKYVSGSQSTTTAISKNEDPCVLPASGNDLYDIFGADLKNKLLNGNKNHLSTDGPCGKIQNMDNDTLTYTNMQEGSGFYLVEKGMSDSGIFSLTGSDNLLDAVVSRACSATKQSSDDNVSCRTTLTKISSSSVPSASHAYDSICMSDKIQRELFDLPKSREKAGTIASSSFKSGCSKDDRGSCSQTTSIYGSQLSAWVGHSVKRDNSVSTAFSKKNDEMGKPNRKRLKPGENPRPRPKDRQMIQDRVKELREIVPNGAKCSIDALLERTIKHMLFLQSVTKHADKLKHTGESKIINKDGSQLLKDNFEGGATWAFEVGSQSMLCPIIVEDLNQPRQMLVEMLCEERGFFLEIADLIRGLGLTILKGVMEARNDKIWARFAVEANRDVTRMEIFMSLVQLLEQTVKMENNNSMMVQHAFSHITPITASGRPSDSLK